MPAKKWTWISVPFGRFVTVLGQKLKLHLFSPGQILGRSSTSCALVLFIQLSIWKPSSESERGSAMTAGSDSDAPLAA